MLIDNNTLNHIGPDFPAFITNNTHTTPHIILTNNRIYHTHVIEAGPGTISDHLPTTVTLMAQAMKIPTPIQFNLKKVDWDKFIEIIQDNIHEVKPNNRVSHQEIDKALQTWYNTITDAMEKHIGAKLENENSTKSRYSTLQ